MEIIDLPGLVVQVGALLDLTNRPIQARLRSFQALLRNGLGRLAIAQSLRFIGSRAGLHGNQGAIAAAGACGAR